MAQSAPSAPTQIVPEAAPRDSQAPRNDVGSTDQPGVPGAAAMPATPGAAAPAAGATRQEVLTLKDLGANSPIRLLGVQGEGSLPFSIRRDEVPTGGKIDLRYSYSPVLIPELSHLTVLLNGEVVGSIPLPKDKSGQNVSLPINPARLRADNRILFRFIGHYTLGCEDPLDPQLALVLDNSFSALTLQLRKLTLANDLSLLPAPFYDSKDMQALTLPFVFSGKPSPATLQAAGVVASWFGSLAAYKGATFPVSFDTVPGGDAVVFATNAEKPAGVTLPSLGGPTISVVPNPGNPETKLLLVMGRTPEELATAAQTLALGSVVLSGDTQVVAAPNIPVRQPYDAPRWIPMDRPVRLGELVPPNDLQGSGLTPGLLTVNFRTAPDTFVWGNTGIPLDVRYRYPVGPWVNFADSRFDVSINNSYLRSLPLTQEGVVQQVKDVISPDFVLNEQRVQIPPYYVFGQNQLQFYYEFKPGSASQPESCAGVLPNNVQESIDPDSTIDLSKTERFTTLPNLSFFVNSGYPFTRLADLSRTAVVIPDQLTPVDVQTYLTLMGMMGDSTGFPVVRVTVVTAGGVDQMADKDLIVLGAIGRQPLIAKWTGNSRLRVDGGRLRVATTSSIDRVYDPNAEQERARVDQLLVQQGNNLATMIGMESPLSSGHTVIMITGSTPEKQLTVLATFRNRELNPLIQGDLMVVTDKVESARVGSEYTVGHLFLLTKIRWWLGNSPLVLILFTLIGVLIIALVAYWLLSRIATRRLAGRPAP